MATSDAMQTPFLAKEARDEGQIVDEFAPGRRERAKGFNQMQDEHESQSTFSFQSIWGAWHQKSLLIQHVEEMDYVIERMKFHLDKFKDTPPMTKNGRDDVPEDVKGLLKRMHIVDVLHDVHLELQWTSPFVKELVMHFDDEVSQYMKKQTEKSRPSKSDAQELAAAMDKFRFYTYVSESTSSPETIPSESSSFTVFVAHDVPPGARDLEVFDWVVRAVLDTSIDNAETPFWWVLPFLSQSIEDNPLCLFNERAGVLSSRRWEFICSSNGSQDFLSLLRHTWLFYDCLHPDGETADNKTIWRFDVDTAESIFFKSIVAQIWPAFIYQMTRKRSLMAAHIEAATTLQNKVLAGLVSCVVTLGPMLIRFVQVHMFSEQDAD